jgi:dGTPase
LVLHLLPEEYKTETVLLYDRIMQVCSYVSRISDSYAIRVHKKLTGNII